MRNYWKLICLAGILLTFTQCGKDSEPEPEPEAITETWQLTYDNYHTLLTPLVEEYKNLTHNVTIVRKGDELSIQGIFEEYPDAWTKFTIKDNKLYFVYPQTLGTDNGGAVYMHWGYIWDEFSSGITFISRRVGFRSGTIQVAFELSYDGNTITAVRGSRGSAGGFWYNHDKEGTMGFSQFSELDETTHTFTVTGPDFPDEPYMINMVFTKVSDSN